MGAMPSMVKSTPAQCVDTALDALSKGRPVVIPNRLVWAAVRVVRLLPHAVAARVIPLAFRLRTLRRRDGNIRRAASSPLPVK